MPKRETTMKPTVCLFIGWIACSSTAWAQDPSALPARAFLCVDRAGAGLVVRLAEEAAAVGGAIAACLGALEADSLVNRRLRDEVAALRRMAVRRRVENDVLRVETTALRRYGAMQEERVQVALRSRNRWRAGAIGLGVLAVIGLVLR